MTTKKDQKFAEAFERLEKLVEWFEGEDLDLDEGIAKFEEGLELAGVCKKKLLEVENKVKSLQEKYASSQEQQDS